MNTQTITEEREATAEGCGMELSDAVSDLHHAAKGAGFALDSLRRATDRLGHAAGMIPAAERLHLLAEIFEPRAQALETYLDRLLRDASRTLARLTEEPPIEGD